MSTVAAYREPVAWIDADRRMGEMLWSAVRHGGLLDARWWRAWSIGVQSAISIEGQILTVDMLSADTEEVRDCRGRRWFADPLTKILISRWHRDHLVYDGDIPLVDCMALSCEPGERGDILSGKFLANAGKAWTFRLPGLMLAYAQGGVPSESVPRSAWERTLYGCHRPVVEVPTPTTPSRRKDAAEQRLADLLSSELRALEIGELEYQSGRKAKAARKTAAVHAIERLPAPRHALQRCLRQWCIYVLKHEKRGRYSIGYSPATVKGYLNALAHLFADLGPGSPLDTPAADLEIHIIQVLDQTEGRLRKVAVKAVISFLRFRAVERPDAALHIDMDEYSVEENAAPNLLLPEDYRRPILAAQACRMALLMLAIDLDANRPLKHLPTTNSASSYVGA